jgi:hypothetical protein
MGLLQDHTGNTSSTRLAFLLTVVTILATWALTCYTKHDLIEFPATAIAMITALAGTKLVQKHIEIAVPSDGTVSPSNKTQEPQK